MQHSKSFFNPKIFVWSPLFVLLLRLLFSVGFFVYNLENPSGYDSGFLVFRGAVNRGIGVLGILSVFVSIGCGIYLSQQSGEVMKKGGSPVKKKIQFSVFDILSFVIYISAFFLPSLELGNGNLGYEVFLMGAATFYVSIPWLANVTYRISFFTKKFKSRVIISIISIVLALLTPIIYPTHTLYIGYYIWIGAFVIKLFAAFDPDGLQSQSKQPKEIEKHLDPVALSHVQEGIYIQDDTPHEKVDEKIKVQEVHEEHNFGKRVIPNKTSNHTGQTGFLNKKSSWITVFFLSMLGVFAIGTVLYQVLWVSHVDKKVQLEMASNTAILAQQDMGQRQETKRRWDQTGIPYDKSALGVEEMSPQQKQKSLDVGIQDGMGDVVTDQAEIKEKAAENIQEKVDQEEVEQDSKSTILENIARMQLEQDSQDQDEEERQSDTAPLIDGIYTQSLGSSEYVLHAKIPTGAEKVVIQTKNEGLIAFIDETYTLQKFDPSAGEFAYNIKPQYGNIAPGTNEYYIEVYRPDGSVSVYEQEIIADTGPEFDMDRERMMDLVELSLQSDSTGDEYIYKWGDWNNDKKEDVAVIYRKTVNNTKTRTLEVYLNIQGLMLKSIWSDHSHFGSHYIIPNKSLSIFDVTGNGDDEIMLRLFGVPEKGSKLIVLDYQNDNMIVMPTKHFYLANTLEFNVVKNDNGVGSKIQQYRDLGNSQISQNFIEYKDGEFVVPGILGVGLSYILQDGTNMGGFPRSYPIGSKMQLWTNNDLEGSITWYFGNGEKIYCEHNNCRKVEYVYKTPGSYTIRVDINDGMNTYQGLREIVVQ